MAEEQGVVVKLCGCIRVGFENDKSCERMG